MCIRDSVNKDPGAEDKFKEIGKAYEALADPETRARYDQFGEAGIGGAAGMPDMGDMGGFGDLFETFFNGFGGQSTQGVSSAASDVYKRQVITLLWASSL